MLGPDSIEANDIGGIDDLKCSPDECFCVEVFCGSAVCGSASLQRRETIFLHHMVSTTKW